MTRFEIERLAFDKRAVRLWAGEDARRSNWPVVYVIDGGSRAKPAVYVGETVNAASRMHQHLANRAKVDAGLRTIRVVVDDTFNKSVCLDLESHLIRWLAGDGQFTVLNGNGGVGNGNGAYYDRDRYRDSFREIFDELKDAGIFTRSIPQIENDDLFKLSPFKALTRDQAIAVEDILEGLFEDLDTFRLGPGGPRSTTGKGSTAVIQGAPGTGKTIVAIFLMKLIADIREYDESDDFERNSMFAELFVPEHRERLASWRMALVVPQQSLRRSIQRVFDKTPRLSRDMVLSPFQVGDATEPFDLLIVDEAHRLSQRASLASGIQNRDFPLVNQRLFGADDLDKTQLDWIVAQSAHRIFLVDGEQSVRPADVPAELLDALMRDARAVGRAYPLTTQMRVAAGTDYVEFVRRMLRGEASSSDLPELGEYDLRMFDDLGEMYAAIREKDATEGLARLVAGYAWKWASRKELEAFDIVLDGVALRWNSTDKDWINAPGSLEEVGSIHTVQGYDLNYAGVVIGPDLRYVDGEPVVDRGSYFDAKGKSDNRIRGIRYTDGDLLRFVRNVYGVLLTRGMRGTYVYVCDPGLREYVRGVLEPANVGRQ